MSARRTRYCQNCLQADGHKPTCLLAIREKTRLSRQRTPRKPMHQVMEEELERYDSDLLGLLADNDRGNTGAA